MKLRCVCASACASESASERGLDATIRVSYDHLSQMWLFVVHLHRRYACLCRDEKTCDCKHCLYYRPHVNHYFSLVAR